MLSLTEEFFDIADADAAAGDFKFLALITLRCTLPSV